MTINRIPHYAWSCKFIVYRIVDGENWFFGAYDEVSKALCAAVECRGQIVETENVEGGIGNA